MKRESLGKRPAELLGIAVVIDIVTGCLAGCRSMKDMMGGVVPLRGKMYR
jgi:hypothetical protein